MLRFITGLDVTLCQSPLPSLPTLPPSSLPLPPSLLYFLSHCPPPHTHTHVSFLLSFCPPVFSHVSPSIIGERLSVKQGPVCSQARLVLASFPIYLCPGQLSPLLCVIAQPCLFSLLRSCLSWLWTSFKACPPYLPLVKHTPAHTNTATDVYTLLLKLYLQGQRIHMVPLLAGHKRTHKHIQSSFTPPNNVVPSVGLLLQIGK